MAVKGKFLPVLTFVLCARMILTHSEKQDSFLNPAGVQNSPLLDDRLHMTTVDEATLLGHDSRSAKEHEFSCS